MIPEFLYRGDNDDSNNRRLRHSIDHYQLQSNLINGGIGRTISENPLLELVNKHVHPGWQETHFLSFTSDKLIAFKYGLNREELDYSNIDKYCSEYCGDDQRDWSFALIKLRLSSIRFNTLSKGVYEGTYESSLRKFQGSRGRIVLIDVVNALMNTNLEHSIQNAKRDSEWLILPANALYDRGQLEYSSILDIGTIGEFTKYLAHDIE